MAHCRHHVFHACRLWKHRERFFEVGLVVIDGMFQCVCREWTSTLRFGLDPSIVPATAKADSDHPVLALSWGHDFTQVDKPCNICENLGRAACSTSDAFQEPRQRRSRPLYVVVGDLERNCPLRLPFGTYVRARGKSVKPQTVVVKVVATRRLAFIVCDKLELHSFEPTKFEREGREKHKERENASHLQYKARLSSGNPKLGWRRHSACVQRRDDTFIIPGFLCFTQYQGRRSP